MMTENEIQVDAYERAQENSCNTDCARYRAGTCVADPGKKTTCYRFKEAYDFYVASLRMNSCLQENKLPTCLECQDHAECKIYLRYEWNLL